MRPSLERLVRLELERADNGEWPRWDTETVRRLMDALDDVRAERHQTATALRALVRDTTRPEGDRLAAVDALAGRLLGEGDGHG